MTTENNMSTIFDMSTYNDMSTELFVDNIGYVDKNEMSTILHMSPAENDTSTILDMSTEIKCRQKMICGQYWMCEQKMIRRQ